MGDKMRIKLSFLLTCLVIFCLMSSVTASDFSESDIMHIDDGLNLKSNDIAVISDSSDVSKDYVGVESFDDDLDDSLNEENLDDSVDRYDSTNDLASLDLSDSNGDIQESVNDDVLDFAETDPEESVNDGVSDLEEIDDGDSVLKDSSLELKDNLGAAIDLNTKKPLYGLVDFGSNTIHFEVYELKNSGAVKSVLDMSETSVTAAYLVDNKLSQKGIDKLIDLYDDFIDIMDFMEVDTRYFFATASLRKIDNFDEVLTAVKEQLGVDINIISGEHEAELSFNSVRDNELITDDGIIIDLGGGSCEVIDFKNKTPVTMESMPIGSFSLYNDYVSLMFPNETEMEAIQNRVLEELSKLEVDPTVSRHDLYGIGGTIKTIRKVLVYLDYIDDELREAPVSMLNDLLDEFKGNSKENYYKILNVNSDRVNTFVPGLIATMTICDYFDIETLHFCKNGIREGLVQELVENDSRKLDPKLDAEDIYASPNEEIQISVGFDNNATGEIAVQLDDVVVIGSVANGTATVSLPHLDIGKHNAKIFYGGDENYLSKSQKIKIYVKSVVLSMDDEIRGYNSSYDYQVKLTDDEGNPLVGKLVLFTVGKIHYYAMTNEKGIAMINPGLKVGTYNVTVSSPLLDESLTKTLSIVKRISGNKNMNLYYNSNQKYKLKILGDDGKAEKGGKTVKVIIDNKSYSYKTDKNGFITIKIDKNFKVGKHTIKVQYKGYKVSNTVNVKHALKSKKLFKVKKSAKKIILTVKLLSNNKKAIKGKKIKFKIKGKTYVAKTNSKGIAKKTLSKKKFKKGKYALKISYLKDTIKANVRIL